MMKKNSLEPTQVEESQSESVKDKSYYKRYYNENYGGNWYDKQQPKKCCGCGKLIYLKKCLYCSLPEIL